MTLASFPFSTFEFANSDNPKFFTVAHCRDSNIRNRASALLKKSLLCEGLWNSFSVGYLASYIQQVEEEGMDSSGFIPEDKRVVLSLWEVDPETGSARLEFGIEH